MATKTLTVKEIYHVPNSSTVKLTDMDGKTGFTYNTRFFSSDLQVGNTYSLIVKDELSKSGNWQILSLASPPSGVAGTGAVGSPPTSPPAPTTTKQAEFKTAYNPELSTVNERNRAMCLSYSKDLTVPTIKGKEDYTANMFFRMIEMADLMVLWVEGGINLDEIKKYYSDKQPKQEEKK